MSQLNLRRFADVDFLKTIGPTRLQCLLSPHTAFFGAQGVMLEELENEQRLEEVTGALVAAPESLPPDLVEALCAIRELATPSGMDSLLREFHNRAIPLPFEDPYTPADVATHALLEQRDLFEQHHGLVQAHRTRSFVVSEGLGQPETFRVPDMDSLRAMTGALEDTLHASGRGKGCRITALQRDGEWVFQIRRGDPIRREGCLKEEGLVPSVVLYRPQVNDFLYYSPQSDELRYNLPGKTVREAVLRVLGETLFGDGGYFTWSNKYTLDPLCRDGVRALVCADVPGLEEIVLKELHVEMPERSDMRMVYASPNVMEDFGADGAFLPQGSKPVRAKFDVRFSGRRAPRVMVIQPPNKLTLVRDGDTPLTETWMLRRGFLKQRSVQWGEHHVVGA